MTTDARTNATDAAETTAQENQIESKIAPRATLRHMPGVIAVSVYMVILAGIDVVYVMQHRIGALYLVLSALFVAAALGLLLLFRWAWALTLAAVALLSALYLRAFFIGQSYPALEQGLFNLVIFLYLVRTKVRDKLR
jgi:hypothetical protein